MSGPQPMQQGRVVGVAYRIVQRTSKPSRMNTKPLSSWEVWATAEEDRFAIFLVIPVTSEREADELAGHLIDADLQCTNTGPCDRFVIGFDGEVVK